MKQMAIFWWAPDLMASSTCGLVMAAAYPSRCSRNFGCSMLRDTSMASASSRSTCSAARAWVI
jgi:hypothetical protein